MPINTDRLFGDLFDVAVPLARDLIVGGDAYEGAQAQDSRRFSRLNGTGPNDVRASMDAPQTWLDFLLGKQSAQKAQGGMSWTPLALLAGGGVILWLALRRR